jgi:flagellar basal-body rod protein FlgF
MELPTYVALSRMDAQSRAMDVVADNVANASTPGFKASRALFSDWLDAQQGATTPPGGRVVAFTQDRATYRDRQQGPITHTSNPLDLALGGEGYFTVNAPGGPRLTRAGRFSPTADGTVADAEGNPVLDTAGQPIRLPAGAARVTITADGTVSTEAGPVGKIGVVQPTDPNALQAEGGRLLVANTPTQPVAAPAVIQGAVEDSNVQPVAEITRMMTLLREFEFTSQFLQGESDRQQKAVDTLLKQNG